MPIPETSVMSRIVSLCKRRGFIFQASEIYGGINGFWDYGPLGVQLKNNLRDAWWRDMVECPPLGPDGKPLSIVGLDSAIIQHPQTWVSSGHVAGFADEMVDCRESKGRYRADHISTFNVLSRSDYGVDNVDFRLSFLAGSEDARQKLAQRIDKIKKRTGGSKYFVVVCRLSDNETKQVKLADFFEANDDGFFPKYTTYTDLTSQERRQVIAPDADVPDSLTEPRTFNLMFETHSGVFQTEESKVYLRPETAQGIFLDFKNVLDTSRIKPPFGIAQIGKAFRNEVTPRNFIFRSREFEQMEMEFFVPPQDGMMWHRFWVNERMRWWEAQGVAKAKLFEHVIEAADRSFYSAATSDIEYKYPFTDPDFGELEGVAYRTDYDLTQHQTHSKVNLEYIDQEAKTRYIPHVIEPAAGLTRGLLVLLCEAYQYDESRASPEWLKLKPSLAPIKLGIFPLVNKDGLPEIAEKLYMNLRRTYTCQLDAKQSIGKRYARMDEAGTPFCITIDGDTLASQTVTVRHRDTAQQEKVALDKLREYLAPHFAN